MAGHKDANLDWNTESRTWDAIQVAVLCDIRVELQRLNALLHCQNAVDIPRMLRKIEAHTRPRRKRK